MDGGRILPASLEDRPALAAIHARRRFRSLTSFALRLRRSQQSPSNGVERVDLSEIRVPQYLPYLIQRRPHHFEANVQNPEDAVGTAPSGAATATPRSTWVPTLDAAPPSAPTTAAST